MDDIPTPRGRTPREQTPDEPTTSGHHPAHYVEWGAVVGGTVVAMAVSFVLLTFGAAVGFGAISPWTTSATAVVSISLGAVFWMILSHVWAFSLGGYLSGRMRHRWSNSPSEVEFRDGAHGLLVWSLAVTIAAIVATLSLVAADGRPSGQAASALSQREPMASQLDTLLRPVKPGPEASTDGVRALAARLLLHSLTKPGPTTQPEPTSHTQLVQLVAARTGLTDADADRRVAESVTELTLAADKARKLAVVFGFLVAATLLISGAAAWVSAQLGGKHRDEGTLWAGLSHFDLQRFGA